MSTPFLAPKCQAFLAAADLRSHQYKLVKFGASNDLVALCGDTDKPVGVLMNAPNSGELAEVAVQGGAKIKVASTVTLQASCASGASGVGRDAVAGEWAIGTFQDAGVTGDIVPVIIDLHQLDKDVS